MNLSLIIKRICSNHNITKANLVITTNCQETRERYLLIDRRLNTTNLKLFHKESEAQTPYCLATWAKVKQ